MEEIIREGVVLDAATPGVQNIACGALEPATQEEIIKFLELVTFFFKQPEKIFFFRERATPATDREISAFFSTRKMSGILPKNLWVARADQLQFGSLRINAPAAAPRTVQGFLRRVTLRNAANLNAAAGVHVHVRELFRTYFPDLGMRSLASANTAEAMQNIGVPLLYLQDPATNQAPTGVLAQAVAANCILLHTLRHFMNTHPVGGGDLVRRLVTRARQYERAGPRHVWQPGRRQAARVDFDVFPENNTKGLTSLLGGADTTDWFTDAQQYSYETPMPRPNLTGVPQQNWPAATQFTVKFLCGIRRPYLNQQHDEYLVYWDQNVPTAARPQVVSFDIRSATWERLNHGFTNAEIAARVSRMKTEILPRRRRGVDWDRLHNQRRGQVDPFDSYEETKSLRGGKTLALLQQAAIYGTFFHDTVTHQLLRAARIAEPQCGYLGVNFIRVGAPNTPALDVQVQARLKRALAALAPVEAYVPLSDMARLCIQYLGEYAAQTIYTQANLEFVFTEFPVFFPYLLLRGAAGDAYKVCTTRVDAVVTYTAPPSHRKTLPPAPRIGIVEFKSVYGDAKLADRLPLKEDVMQALMGAYMFEETTGETVDRVFLVYTSKYRTVSIFDYPYQPRYTQFCKWQRDCIMSWFYGTIQTYPESLYVDHRHAMLARYLFAGGNRKPFRNEFYFVDSLRENQATPTARPLPNNQLQDERPESFTRTDENQTVELGKSYKLTAVDTRILTWNAEYRWLAKANWNTTLPLEANHLRAAPPPAPAQAQAQAAAAYRAGPAGLAVAMQAARTGARLYPPGDESARRQALKNRVAAIVLGIGNLNTVHPAYLRGELLRRFGDADMPRVGADPPANTWLKENSLLLTRSINRALNTRQLEKHDADEPVRRALPHWQQRGMLTAAELDAMLLHLAPASPTYTALQAQLAAAIESARANT